MGWSSRKRINITQAQARELGELGLQFSTDCVSECPGGLRTSDRWLLPPEFLTQWDVGRRLRVSCPEATEAANPVSTWRVTHLRQFLEAEGWVRKCWGSDRRKKKATSSSHRSDKAPHRRRLLGELLPVPGPSPSVRDGKAAGAWCSWSHDIHSQDQSEQMDTYGTRLSLSLSPRSLEAKPEERPLPLLDRVLPTQFTESRHLQQTRPTANLIGKIPHW